MHLFRSYWSYVVKINNKNKRTYKFMGFRIIPQVLSWYSFNCSKIYIKGIGNYEENDKKKKEKKKDIFNMFK